MIPALIMLLNQTSHENILLWRRHLTSPSSSIPRAADSPRTARGTPLTTPSFQTQLFYSTLIIRHGNFPGVHHKQPAPLPPLRSHHSSLPACVCCSLEIARQVTTMDLQAMERAFRKLHSKDGSAKDSTPNGLTRQPVNRTPSYMSFPRTAGDSGATQPAEDPLRIF